MTRAFTLLELVTVMAVIALSTALAVTVFRGESSAKTLENFTLGLDSYFARVRYRATEEGDTWEVYFDASTRTLTACRKMTAGEYSELEQNDQKPPPALTWSWPEKLTVECVNVEDGENVEVVSENLSLREQKQEEEKSALSEFVPPGIVLFYFYADGLVGGSGNYLLVRCGKLEKRFEILPLTGRLLEKKDDTR